MAKLSKMESSLNEKDSLTDMLNTEKMLLDSYSLAIKEGSTKSLRSQFLSCFTKAQENQFTVFSEMKEKGYYKPMPAEKQMLDQKSEDFIKMGKEIAQN